MRIAEIKLNDVANGDGVVVSLWTQGCSHRCDECHNQSTWDFKGGREFTEKDAEFICSNINKNNVNRNLSLLGGEPLEKVNLDSLSTFLMNFKMLFPEKKIYMWSGFLFEDIIKDKDRLNVLEYVDILIDGRFELDKKDLTLKWRGSSNQRVIDVEKSLSEKRVVLYEKVLTNN